MTKNNAGQLMLPGVFVFNPRRKSGTQHDYKARSGHVVIFPDLTYVASAQCPTS